MFDIFDAEQMLGIRLPQVTLTLHPRLSMVCHLRWRITRHMNHKPFGRVCNRAAVVDGGGVRVSSHSRLGRQCGVIEVVTAPRLISHRHGV